MPPDIFDTELTPAERAQAEAFVASVGGDTDDDEKSAEKPEEQAKAAKPAEEDGEKPESKEKAARASDAAPDDGENDDDDRQELGKRAQKRIGQLTAQKKAFEAKTKALEARVAQMEATMAKTMVAAEPEEVLDEYATPEERREYIARQDARRREVDRNERRRERLGEMYEEAGLEFDGSDGKPTFQDMMDRYKDRIDQEPGFEIIKNKIMLAKNPCKVFYHESLRLVAQEGDEDDDGLDGERGASQVLAPGGKRTKKASQPKGSPEEIAWVERAFGTGGQRLLPGEK